MYVHATVTQLGAFHQVLRPFSLVKTIWSRKIPSLCRSGTVDRSPQPSETTDSHSSYSARQWQHHPCSHPTPTTDPFKQVDRLPPPASGNLRGHLPLEERAVAWRCGGGGVKQATANTMRRSTVQQSSSKIDGVCTKGLDASDRQTLAGSMDDRPGLIIKRLLGSSVPNVLFPLRKGVSVCVLAGLKPCVWGVGSRWLTREHLTACGRGLTKPSSRWQEVEQVGQGTSGWEAVGGDV